jgi:ferredoxin-type protein NapH
MSLSKRHKYLKIIKKTGLSVFVLALAIFVFSVFVGGFRVEKSTFESFLKNEGIGSEILKEKAIENLSEKHFDYSWQLTSAFSETIEFSNNHHKSAEEWNQVVWTSPQELSFKLAKLSATGFPVEQRGLFFLLTFVLAFFGALLFVLPDVVLLGKPGIKNDHIYHNSATNRGWIGWLAFIFLVSFYLLLYFRPAWIVNWTFAADWPSLQLSGASSSQWFLYGLLYTTVMLAMGIRMFVKYRGNQYQMFRTASVLFFQIIFAFLLVEILPLFQLPAVDLKNAWPLDYDFLFDYNVKYLFESGNAGKYFFFWGIVLSVIVVPVLTYFYGKRWYCSWVCGCGGLAETLGDPYRQHSDKSLFAWKIERWLVHGVLVVAVLMTVWTGWHTYHEINGLNPKGGSHMLLGISAFDVREWYGLLIGAWFAGVIGTGFYPIFGNRVWCRFGCPLAAYLGIVQRFKSRFRITTNGGQCISCGNCSTYCEMGIDVRSYAQKGQNIVRASCVGCGVCAAVCPRGVLKLENAPEAGRINDNPILIGPEGVSLSPEITRGR